jgi:hypothetical protein
VHETALAFVHDANDHDPVLAGDDAKCRCELAWRARNDPRYGCTVMDTLTSRRSGQP